MSITDTNQDNGIVLNTTMARHSNEIAALENALQELLARIRPVCRPEEYPLDVAQPEPKSMLCDIAQMIHKETQHVENMIAHVTRTLGLLQLPQIDIPKINTDAVCLNR